MSGTQPALEVMDVPGAAGWLLETWPVPSDQPRSAGMGAMAVSVPVSSSQKAAGVAAPPGRRQPMPTMEMPDAADSGVDEVPWVGAAVAAVVRWWRRPPGWMKPLWSLVCVLRW